jgi:hypothetical protein
MPIPTNAPEAPDPPPRSPTSVDEARLEYFNPDRVTLDSNNQNLLVRNRPQIIPRPKTKLFPSGYYNVFMASTPTGDKQVLDWAKYTVGSLVDIEDGAYVESMLESNLRSKNNIFKPDNLNYTRANLGIVNNFNNPPSYNFMYTSQSGISNYLSNAGMNYHG